MQLQISARIAMPEPYTTGTRFMRVYRKSAKEAVKLALLEYRQGDFKEHFSRAARSRFNHKKRSARYKAKKRKQYGSVTDLVKSGTTRDHMLMQRPKVTVQGEAGSALYGTMYLKFPFPVTQATDNPRGVSIQQMKIELATWDQKALQRIQRSFKRHFHSELRRNLQKSPTILKRIKRYL